MSDERPVPAPEHKHTRYDLDSAVAVADAIRTHGGTLSNDQLAVLLGYNSAVNGAYMSRVAATRMFGLIEGKGNAITITPRARDILEPINPTSAREARVKAFLAVPLFGAFFREHEGRPLPANDALENELANRFNVPRKSVKMALARLRDSATQAGLFEIGGPNRMVLPVTVTDPEPGGPAELAPQDEEKPKLPPPPVVTRRHSKLIEGALDMLPERTGWSEDALADWLELIEMALRVQYNLPRRRASATSEKRGEGEASQPVR